MDDAMTGVPAMTDSERWTAVLARDATLDGAFVYAVTSTGVFCRPSCPSRRPRRENVRFFEAPEGAAVAGFRPCRRCRPHRAPALDPAVVYVRAACQFIEEAEGVPSLEALASHIGVSPFHLQRTFKRVTGLSPRDYAHALRAGRFRAFLRAGDDVSGAAYEAGFGSASRVYESAPGQLGMTPATYKRGGAGARMRYAVVPSGLGLLMVAATERGVSFVALGDDEAELIAELHGEFPKADIEPDDGTLAEWTAAVLCLVDGQEPAAELPLDVRATAFQWRVWRELTAIPAGETRSYTQIAAALGNPKAQRAVGRACASNPIALVVPCHRAVRNDGGLGGYRWGLRRKERLLAAEGGKTRRK